MINVKLFNNLLNESMVVIGWSITVVIGFFYKCFTLISGRL
ncbi:hypothetical protein N506_1p20 (plasmid) [Lactobacillus gasseri DSM 14869]|nr:hypothetical protein N506_1p20 [Lactobacillus gasseri DSM 14869]